MSKKEQEELLEKIFREYIASLESEKYRAEMESGKVFPFYDKEIEKARIKNKKFTNCLK